MIEIYSTVFKKLLKWKIYQNLNNKIFLILKNLDKENFKGLINKIYFKGLNKNFDYVNFNLKRILIVVNNAINIVNIILTYVFYEVKNKFYFLFFYFLLNFFYF